MDADQLNAFRQTAAKFAKNEIKPMIETEDRDGDLDLLPTILKTAAAEGIVASPDSNSPGYQYGVWGIEQSEEGPAFSLALLEEIATVCAGTSACIHFAGLGSREVSGTQECEGTPAVAFFDAERFVAIDPQKRQAENRTQLIDRDGTPIINGCKPFVYAPPGWHQIVVYARSENGLKRLLVSPEENGAKISHAGSGHSLAALQMFSVEFTDCKIIDELSPETDPRDFLRLCLLGIAAIALGNARGALAVAKTYIEERYQGGEVIAGHPLISDLLGEAAILIDCSASIIEGAASVEGGRNEMLARAVSAKAKVTTDCAVAVSNCMQMLGGYGYMEDYLVEKRLRDALALKSMVIKPDYLKQLRASLEMGSQ
jgi:butyryl-CoA dehydrogenase